MMADKTSDSQKIRLIVCDVDGTLVDSHGKCSKATIQAINNVQRKGIDFCLGTGRNNNMIQTLLDQLENVRYSISNNGSLVYDHQLRRVIYSHPLSLVQSRGILREIREKGWEFICYSQYHMYYTLENELIKEKRGQIITPSNKKTGTDVFSMIKVDSAEQIQDSEHIYKIGVYSEETVDFSEVKKIAEGFKAELKNSGERFEVIVPQGISKGTGLKKLQEYLSIGVDNTMVFGDYDNDLPLFEHASFRIAMANASEKLKKEATVITASNDEDGVAKMLNQLKF